MSRVADRLAGGIHAHRQLETNGCEEDGGLFDRESANEAAFHATVLGAGQPNGRGDDFAAQSPIDAPLPKLS
jgi:hypothetical protein